METGIDGKNIYKAMQVEENGLLKNQILVDSYIVEMILL
jgi:hypothetical protein